MRALNLIDPASAVAARKERAPRSTTVLIAGKLIRRDGEALCRVRNISTTGMMIETRAPLTTGEDVRIGLRCGEELQARVAWAQDGAAGLAFLTPTDVQAMLAVEAPRSRLIRSRAPRAPRFGIECAMEVELRDELHNGTLLDISQGGARLRLAFRPAPDEPLTLSIPGLPLKSAGVRWSDHGIVGVRFYQPLPFDVLATWVETSLIGCGGFTAPPPAVRSA